MRTVTLAALFVFIGAPTSGAGQAPPSTCEGGPGAWIETGWSEYRSGRIAASERAFTRALTCDTESVGALVGLGYAALRQGHDERSARHFETSLEIRPDLVDALVGLGLLAWRNGEVGRAGELAARASELAPENEEAVNLLARVEAGAERVVPHVARPPLILPDTLVYPSRTNGDRFEVRGADGWEPFYVKGVNLGAALPGKHPSEFPDAATYALWIDQMHELGANVVRTYTIHPPIFYQALEAHNKRHPDAPLWLVHGVWTELPPDDDYEDPEWEAAFFDEMRRVVDLLHGRADIQFKPGRAGGAYTADVSQWVQSFVIGREWEPFSVIEFNKMRPELTRWEGRYLTLERGTPMEVWLAKACEEIVAYETETYRAQRPVAYTNWPTLDPMHHPTETTVKEEVAIRAGLGEVVGKVPLEYDNDGANLSAAAVHETTAFPAGHFASYHVYPYYPDFMILDPAYARASSSWGPSNYFGYLEDLKAAHPDMPVVVAEYGVPASYGIAHLQPQGWHHGGHSEASMAETDIRMTREIAEAGLAGGILFAWIDEWFKKNWITIEFEIPLERNRLWLNRLDAEQHYGIFAMEPGSGLAGDDLRGRHAAWSQQPALYESTDGASLRAHADEGYLWLRFQGPESSQGHMLPTELDLGFDTVDPAAGDHRWPERDGPLLAAGLEFVLRMDAEGARLMVDPASNPFRLEPVREGLEISRPISPNLPSEVHTSLPPQDVFVARSEQRFNRPFRSLLNADGVYDSLRVITNRPRFGRDGTEFLGAGYDRGVLPSGPLPDGFWETDAELGVVEIRLPWALLNFTDPSERRVLQGLPDGVSRADIGAEPSAKWDASAEGAFGTVTVPDIGIAARWSMLDTGDDAFVSWPAGATDFARFTWDKWEQPEWRARKRPVFDALQRLFQTLEPAVMSDVDRSAGGGGR